MRSHPLSATQRYFHQQIVAEGFDPTWQHLQVGVQLERALDPGSMERAAHALEARHPILAARLIDRDGRAELALDAPSARALRVADLREARREEVDLWIAAAADEPFDLLAGPLWRALLVRAPGGRTILQLVAHHLIADGISMWLLLGELARLHAGADPGPPPASYERFAADEIALLAGPEADRRLEVWDRALAGADPGLPLPDVRSPHRFGMTETLAATYVPGLAGVVAQTARRARVIPLAVLLAAVATTIKDATGQDDLVLATISDVRGPAYATTIGTFSELVLVRDPPARDRASDRRLVELRNALFQGWRSHLPIQHLRERLPVLGDRGPAANPCEVFLNFVPATRASDWAGLVAPFEDPSLSYYAPPGRQRSPARRQLGPWLSFAVVQAGELSASATVHRHPAVAEVNRDVVAGLPPALAALGGDRAPAAGASPPGA